ncbi:helix-turn-helix transcriptional regulator [Streptomyces sp. NPDC053493]|uniref:helix-turn-helix transcriptional regulator n=1 Tax=Streptomyces sp. NPDC053493 TaxID=3365705 RepID=UPI0037D1622C
MMDRDYAEPLDVPALARAALMSAGHFQRSFRAAYGETPYSYLMTRRVERAKALLRRGDLSVTEVCFAVGCTSLGSFSTRFTELVGESPSAYRARNHEAGEPIPACVAKFLTRPTRAPRPAGPPSASERPGSTAPSEPAATSEPAAPSEAIRIGEAKSAPAS